MSVFSTEDRSDIINSPLAAEPVGAYPHARRVGNLLFLSGIGPRERGQKAIPGVSLASDGSIEAYDITTQTLSVFRNIRHILDAAGSRWENIVDVQVFLTNMKQDFPVFNALYAEHFTHVQATRTTIQIDCLPTPIAVELKIIATID
jgi:2-aminomuconate deaminase